MELIIDLEKARKPTGQVAGRPTAVATQRKTVEYRVHPKSGKPYTKFVPKISEQKFLLAKQKKGIVVEKVEAHSSTVPVLLLLTDKIAVPAKDREEHLRDFSAVKPHETFPITEAQQRFVTGAPKQKLTRLGDKLSFLDPTGVKQGKWLAETGSKIQEIKDGLAVLTAAANKLSDKKGARPELVLLAKQRADKEGELQRLTLDRNKLQEQFIKRPLSWKISRVQALKDAIKVQEAELDKLKDAKAPKPGKMTLNSVHTASIEAEIHRLKMQLKGVKGMTHVLDKDPERLPTLSGVSHMETVEPINGLMPSDGMVSYLLSAGKWGNTLDGGRNNFGRNEASHLRKEFEQITRNILDGRVMNTGASHGYASFIPGFKAYRDDLYQDAFLKLFDLAGGYTKAIATEQEEKGNNFKKYAVYHLNRFIQDQLRNKMRQGRDTAHTDDLEPYLNVVDDEAAYTSSQIRDLNSPTGGGYASQEDVAALRDFYNIATQRLGSVETTILMSRLNRLNPTDHPRQLEPGGKLKTISGVLADVVSKYGTTFTRDAVMSCLATLFSPEVTTWHTDLKKEERQALQHGLKLLLTSNVSLPENTQWRIAHEPTKNKPGVSLAFAPHSDIKREIRPDTKLFYYRSKRLKDRTVYAEMARTNKSLSGNKDTLRALLNKLAKVLRLQVP